MKLKKPENKGMPQIHIHLSMVAISKNVLRLKSRLYRNCI